MGEVESESGGPEVDWRLTGGWVEGGGCRQGEG